jgi:AraC-like DNA-binding protein
MELVDMLLEAARPSQPSVLVRFWPGIADPRGTSETSVAVATVLRGTVSLALDGGGLTRLAQGVVAIMRGPSTTTPTDSPGSDHPKETRSWGAEPVDAPVLFTANYSVLSEASQHLLAGLPPLLLTQADSVTAQVIDLIATESALSWPGQRALLDRLADLLVAAGLRAWFPVADEPSWVHGASDAIVGPVLALMHNEPGRPWTIDMLARRVGASRPLLARRFHQLVGETPLAYLTNWRMALASDWLRTTDATIASVAEQLGYTTQFAFSVAFKRVRGISPSTLRASGHAASDNQSGAEA